MDLLCFWMGMVGNKSIESAFPRLIDLFGAIPSSKLMQNVLELQKMSPKKENSLLMP